MQKLGDYIKEYSVRNRFNEDIPVYSVTNSQGFCRDYFGKEVASSNKKTYKIVPRHAFAYNPSRINVGSVDYQHCEDKVIVSPLYNVFTVNENIIPEYLYYYLKSPSTIKRIETVASGSVRNNLKLSMLCEFPIEVPSISKQKKILNILREIRFSIDCRKTELEHLDNLIKARFVEMFGKIKNGIPIEDSGLFISDGNYSAKYPRSYEFIPSGIPFIRANNIKDGTITDEDMYFISSEKHMELRKGHLLPGDVLITTRGSIGQLGIVPSRHSDSNINAQIVLLRDTQGAYLPEFLLYALQTFEVKKQFIKQQTGTTLKQLPVHNLKKVVFVDAPIDLQHRFASFVHQVDKSKFAVQKSLEKTQQLFDSLMQEYFG